MHYEKEKIIPYKKRLFTPLWKFKSFLKHNRNYVTVVSLSGFFKRDDLTIINTIIDSDLKAGIKRSAIDAFRKEHSLTWRQHVHSTYSGSIKGND